MTIGIEIIDKLKLNLAFDNHFDDCWTVRADSKLLVIDDDVTQKSRFSDDEMDEERALIIINSHNKVITLISIDHALIENHPGGIADCAVMDNQKLAFVEFKTNAYGNSDESIRDTFEKASSQLKETLQVFGGKLTSLGIDLIEAIAVECRIIVSHRYPKASALKQDFRALFAQETNGIDLIFERLIEFV